MDCEHILFNFFINKVSEFLKFIFGQYNAFWGLFQKKTLDGKIHPCNVCPDGFWTGATIFAPFIKEDKSLVGRFCMFLFLNMLCLIKLFYGGKVIHFPPITCFVSRNSRAWNVLQGLSWILKPLLDSVNTREEISLWEDIPNLNRWHS